MSETLQSETVSAGALVFRQGEPGDRAYLIERGAVEILTREGTAERVLATLRDGEVFGEMTLIDRQPRSASARALDDCVLLPITRELVERKLNGGDPLTRLLLKLILSRFRGVPGPAPAPTGQDPNSTLTQVAAELTLASDLRAALESGALEVHYQPIVHLRDRHLAGFEALLRWNRGGAGFVPPPCFIGVAEETGLILPLGRWVLGEACAMLRDAAAACPGDVFMSVNLSAHQLHEPGEAQRLLEVIRTSGVPAGRLKLELTETALLSDPERAAAALGELRAAGVDLAIDDFGTGYSSLSYLHRYPMQTLKIDRSFVDPLPGEPASRRVVRAILGLARELDMLVVAEGVESEAQRRCLEESGCELGQGFLFARPAPRDGLGDWLGGRDGAGRGPIALGP